MRFRRVGKMSLFMRLLSRRTKLSVFIGGALLTILLLTSVSFSTPEGSDNSVSTELAKALDMYAHTKLDEGMDHARGLFERDSLSARDSVAIYECMSVCTYAKGKNFRASAFGYLDTMAAIGPCVNVMPQDFWPRQLKDRWYSKMQAVGKITCPDEGKSGLKTIAFLPFDNFSVKEYQESLGNLSLALSEFFAYDFGSFSELRIVEREKLDYLLKEQELIKSGKIDKSTAVKLGKIVGAQMMVFGLISQTDGKTARMGIKVVSVETSEIIATVDKEGKPDFNKMQKELVEELAKKLNFALNDETKELLKIGGTDSMDALELYSVGLKYMDEYDYKQAYEHFKKAYEKDNNFMQAKQKMEIYWPLIG